MYDMYYDLLNILYMNLKQSNCYQNLEETLVQLEKIYQSKNIIGGVANMNVLPYEEMKKRFGIFPKEASDIKKMFLESKQFLENLKLLTILPENAEFLYRMNATDDLRKEDLASLKRDGLHILSIVGEESNCYGKGRKEKNGGLSKEGQELVERALQLGLSIDLSQTNEETFYDILTEIDKRQQEAGPLLFSNINEESKEDPAVLKNRLEYLKEKGAYLSLSCHSIEKDKETLLLAHLTYLKEELHYPEEKIFLSTGNISDGQNAKGSLPEKEKKHYISNLLIANYGQEFSKKLLLTNPSQFIHEVKQKRLQPKN